MPVHFFLNAQGVFGERRGFLILPTGTQVDSRIIQQCRGCIQRDVPLFDEVFTHKGVGEILLAARPGCWFIKRNVGLNGFIFQFLHKGQIWEYLMLLQCALAWKVSENNVLSLDMSYPPFSMKVSISRTRQDACIRQLWSLKEITGSQTHVRFPYMAVKHSLHRGLAYLFHMTAKKTTAIAQSLPFHNHLTTLLYAAYLIHYQSALYLRRTYRKEKRV